MKSTKVRVSGPVWGEFIHRWSMDSNHKGAGMRKYFHVMTSLWVSHDDVIKWKHFPRYWPFVRGIHRSPVNTPHKGQWRGALMFSLICVCMNDWLNNREAGDLRRYHAHYDVTVMTYHNIPRRPRPLPRMPRDTEPGNTRAPWSRITFPGWP